MTDAFTPLLWLGVGHSATLLFVPVEFPEVRDGVPGGAFGFPPVNVYGFPFGVLPRLCFKTKTPSLAVCATP